MMMTATHDPDTAAPMTMTCICGEPTCRPVAMRKSGYEISRCEHCGVGRTLVQNFEPEDHYQAAYFTGQIEGAYLDYEGSEATLRKEFSDQVDFLRSYAPNGGKLLEVGCAYGFFLQEAKPYYDVYGFEIAQAAVDFCRRSGLDHVKQGVITEEFLQQHGPFDAIVMLDVIEHIDDVDTTTAILTKHLVPGGIFLVTTGDWSSLPAKITGEKWRLMTPPLHLWFFTPKSLTAMLDRCGLSTINISHPWKLVPLELILSQAFSMMGSKWRPSLPNGMRNLGVPANMFDAMRMVFRKR